MPFQFRVDAKTLPALIFGGLLLSIAIAMGVYVWRARRALDRLVENDPQARQHADRQFRRRMQISVMLGIVGILIPLGDQLEDVFVKRHLLFWAWISCVLLLVVWMILMALGDWLSTVTYSAVARSRLRYERRELEEEIRRYHAQRNGHSIEESDEFRGP
jgi:hypothetical protein